MPLTRSRRRRLKPALAVLVGWVVFSVSLASACTIPVFRYALERWESDRFLVVVYHGGRLTTEQNSALDELSQHSSMVGGPLNTEVVRYDLTSPSPPPLLDVQPPSTDRPLPWVEVRSRLDRTTTAPRWQGSLGDAVVQPGVFDSPARSEIVRRILSGHSSVWLIIAPEEQSRQLSEQLQANLDDVTRDLALPQGIGLPGSELYAPVPLEIRYSVLPISHTDPKEQQFLKWLCAFTSGWRTDAAYVIPVFGRCRALDVIPYGDADLPLIEDVASFLCGACSCRVKQANPGFDLLVSVNWDERLFGESNPQGTAAEAQRRGALPEYLAIPTGNQAALTAEQTLTSKSAARPPIAADQVIENNSTASGTPIHVSKSYQTSSAIKLLVLLVTVALVSGAILTGVVLMRR